MDQKNVAYFTYFGGICNLALLVTSITLWIVSSSWYPNIDGVSVYEMLPYFPDRNAFRNTLGKTNADEVFMAETMMINYCLFPSVYNELIKKNASMPGEITAYLKTRGLSQSQAEQTEVTWADIMGDFSAIEKTNTEYSIPYSGLIVPTGKPEPSSRFFPPVCRCINKVLSVFETRPNTNEEFNRASEGIDNCMRTQYITKRQSIMGGGGKNNDNEKNRKFISRYALQFQLCFVFTVGYFYNKIDFANSVGCCGGRNWMYYTALLLVFLVMWFTHVFAAINSVSTENAFKFSGIIILPAVFLAVIVEYMWSVVAKQVDIGRRTYMHPLGFYFTMSALCTMALIENGVFSLSVIITHVFYCNVISMAYAGAVFISHGKLWKTNPSSRTGFLLMIFLCATNQIFYMIPVFPVNCQLNIIWVMPVVFAVLCFSKIVFIDHFMNDEPNIDSDGKFNVTHSDHVINKAHVLIIGTVVFYYTLQLAYMGYGRPDSHMLSSTGGKMSSRLNFELGETYSTGRVNIPIYDSRNMSTKGVIFFNP